MGKIIKYVCDKCGEEIESLNFTFAAKLEMENVYQPKSSYTSPTKFLCLRCYRDLGNYYDKFYEEDRQYERL